jgi:hypothetical protein
MNNTATHRLTKLFASKPHEALTASSIEEYRNSDTYSPPVDYYVEGWPYTPPKVGYQLTFIRNNRNGIKVNGIMQTTPILEISTAEDGISQILETRNSIYILTEIC